MLTKREIGHIGESLAVNHLISEDYEILETNWRYSRAEIDIIAQKEGVLIFIEVKTRTSQFYGQPEDAIGQAKEALIMDAAQRYMDKISYDWEVRFDVISIIVTKSGQKKALNHFEDVFF